MASLLEDADQNLTLRMRNQLTHLWEEWKQLETGIKRVRSEIDALVDNDPACQRQRQIPGIGPLVSTATMAAIGNDEVFRRGREFAAWLGLVPLSIRPGGTARLLGISKRGTIYLRRMFIYGSRTVLLIVKYDSGIRFVKMPGNPLKGEVNQFRVAAPSHCPCLEPKWMCSLHTGIREKIVRWRALVVDDEEAIATTSAAILQADGFETETASSGEQAKQMLSASSFDLVVTDLKMETEMAGYDVAEFASKRAQCPVVIMVSAYAALATEWQNHGVDAFFQKPTNTRDLLATIARLLANRTILLKAVA